MVLTFAFHFSKPLKKTVLKLGGRKLYQERKYVLKIEGSSLKHCSAALRVPIIWRPRPWPSLPNVFLDDLVDPAYVSWRPQSDNFLFGLLFVDMISSSLTSKATYLCSRTPYNELMGGDSQLLLKFDKNLFWWWIKYFSKVFEIRLKASWDYQERNANREAALYLIC